MPSTLKDLQDALYRMMRSRQAVVLGDHLATMSGQIDNYVVDSGTHTDFLKVTIKIPVPREK